MMAGRLMLLGLLMVVANGHDTGDRVMTSDELWLRPDAGPMTPRGGDGGSRAAAV